LVDDILFYRRNPLTLQTRRSSDGFDLPEKRLAVLGAGKIGGILLRALLTREAISAELTCANVQHEDRARSLSEELGIRVGTDNCAAVHDADIVLVCVKPQLVQTIVEQIRPSLSKHQLIISVAASVIAGEIEKELATDVPIVRAMPNTPSALGVWHDAAVQGKICGHASFGDLHVHCLTSSGKP
jgi:pyrroline-5-carboxylate reductase